MKICFLLSLILLVVLAVTSLADGSFGGGNNEEDLAALEEAIIQQGEAETVDEALANRRRRGFVNGYPVGFWIGRILLHGRGKETRWPAFWRAQELLEADPVLRDGLFRQAAQDKRMPDAGKTVLLGYLAEPITADFALLNRVYDRALAAGLSDRFRMLPDPSKNQRPSATRPIACLVAYALAKLGKVDDLVRLYAEVPPDDPVLKAELAYSLASCPESAGASAVASYVGEFWNPIAASTGFEASLKPNIWGPKIHSVFEGSRERFDADYRSRSILDFLRSLDSTHPVLFELIANQEWHPYLRMFIMSELSFHGEDRAELRAKASQILEEILAGECSAEMREVAYEQVEKIENAR